MVAPPTSAPVVSPKRYARILPLAMISELFTELIDVEKAACNYG
jgi:hypothetical protein